MREAHELMHLQPDTIFGGSTQCVVSMELCGTSKRGVIAVGLIPTCLVQNYYTCDALSSFQTTLVVSDDFGPNGAKGRAVFSPALSVSLVVTLYRVSEQLGWSPTHRSGLVILCQKEWPQVVGGHISVIRGSSAQTTVTLTCAYLIKWQPINHLRCEKNNIITLSLYHAEVLFLVSILVLLGGLLPRGTV